LLFNNGAAFPPKMCSSKRGNFYNQFPLKKRVSPLKKEFWGKISLCNTPVFFLPERKISPPRYFSPPPGKNVELPPLN